MEKFLDFYYFSVPVSLAGFIAAFLTLAVFSFLYKDNPIYKFAEYLFIGVATGYYTVKEFNDSIMPNLILHVGKAFDGWRIVEPWYLVRLGAGIMGIMMLLHMVPKLSWLARWPLALMIGAFAGLKLIGKAEADLVAQVQDTIVPGGKPIIHEAMLMPEIQWLLILKALILFVGVLGVLIYFFFSFEHKGPLKGMAKIGIITLMITFGASFGFTVMGRVSLLIGRVQDLIEYAGTKYFHGTFISFAFILIFLF
ncbi:MAG: hypothetical protein D6785_07915, partial [Planctomycetota bacterium]